MPPTAAILSLTIAVAGWYYLFYSQSARRLDGIEAKANNDRRRRLRRINGATLVMLAALFYTGFNISPDTRPKTFVCIWLTVFVLLIMIVLLAVADLRLTARLRRKP